MPAFVGIGQTGRSGTGCGRARWSVMTRSRKLHPVEKADLKIARKVGLDQRSAPGRRVAHFAELGDQPPMVALSLSVAGIGALRRDERMARTGLRMLTAHALSTMAKLLVKDLVDRTRPGALNEKPYRLEEGHSRDGRMRSMPSGHTAGAIAVGTSIGDDYPRTQAAAVLVSSAIAAAQPPSRNHYLSDIVVGGAIGLAAAGSARLLIPVERTNA